VKTPYLTSHAPSFIRRSKRLLLRTKPLPEISGPVAEFESATTNFEDLYNRFLTTRRGLLLARANQRQATTALGRQFRGVGLAILTSSEGRRKSEVYRQYFPQGYGAVLKLSAEAALPIAAGILEVMSGETDADVLNRREPLTAARDRLVTVAAATAAAAAEHGRAKANLEEGKLVWWKAHNTFYFAVRSIYSDRRSYVESLFNVNGKKKSDQDEESKEGGAVATSPATSPITLSTPQTPEAPVQEPASQAAVESELAA
jgi:hypothetical protein